MQGPNSFPSTCPVPSCVLNNGLGPQDLKAVVLGLTPMIALTPTCPRPWPWTPGLRPLPGSSRQVICCLTPLSSPGTPDSAASLSSSRGPTKPLSALQACHGEHFNPHPCPSSPALLWELTCPSPTRGHTDVPPSLRDQRCRPPAKSLHLSEALCAQGLGRTNPIPSQS